MPRRRQRSVVADSRRVGDIMIQTMNTAWLYAYSPNGDSPQYTYYTVYTGNRNGRAVLATISLSYLTTLSGLGAGAWIRSVTPPFGPPADFHDFAVNSFFCTAGDLGHLWPFGAWRGSLCAGQSLLLLVGTRHGKKIQGFGDRSSKERSAASGNSGGPLQQEDGRDLRHSLFRRGRRDRTPGQGRARARSAVAGREGRLRCWNAQSAPR
jgi:hypothetical protein